MTLNIRCEICERKFGWRYEVMFHALCHKTDEAGNAKNRVCPECDTAFKVPIGLKHHLLLHTGEMPYLCLHCWRSFSSHIDLKLHIRKEHLQHLDPKAQEAAAKAEAAAAALAAKRPASASKARGEPRRKRLKMEADATNSAANAAAGGASATQSRLITDQQILAAVQAATAGGLAPGENIQLLVQSADGSETQTILVNGDGSIVQAGEQDMIVVIQSDDLDQSQGQQLIMVDPSQLQQIVGADGQTVTLVEASPDEAAMILGDGGDGKYYLAAAEEEGEVAPGARLVGQETNGETMTTTLVVEDDVADGLPAGAMIVSDAPVQQLVAQENHHGQMTVHAATEEEAAAVMAAAEAAAAAAAAASNGEVAPSEQVNQQTTVDEGEARLALKNIEAAAAAAEESQAA
jgi:hypothetical protein